MLRKAQKITIINRSFWPIYPVIGEALLRLAEELIDEGHSVSVITQDHSNIKQKLIEFDRGNKVRFYLTKALSVSSSGLLIRLFDAMFFCFWVIIYLIWDNPKKVYISTDPPILVPFAVMIYTKIFKKELIYHLQDIHPEALNAVKPINDLLFKFLKAIDAITMRNANSIITINKTMAEVIKSRSATRKKIHELDNPSVSFDGLSSNNIKKLGFSFCGTAGRMQRMPLLLNSIERYFEKGGVLEFVFAGTGIYVESLKSLDKKYKNFSYLGNLSSKEAAKVSSNYSWALLTIEDNVTEYAFPSRTSSYVKSGANIFAICGKNTSVGLWVEKHNVGIVKEPDISIIVNTFFDIENGIYNENNFRSSREILNKILSFKTFIRKLKKIVLD